MYNFSSDIPNKPDYTPKWLKYPKNEISHANWVYGSVCTLSLHYTLLKPEEKNDIEERT
jgi:hypothetical protein